MSGIDLDDKIVELASKLTSLQRKFAINVVAGMSQRKAYIKAGGTAKTEKAQDSISSRMLADARVNAFYQALMEKAQNNAIMTKQEALESLSRSARVKITDICDFTLEDVGEDEDGNRIMQTVWKMKHSDEIKPEVLEAIKSVTFTTSGPKIELYDRNGSIKILSDLQGWNSIPVKFEMDRNAKPHEKANQILNAISTGEIPPETGTKLIQSIKAVVDIEEYTELKERIERLEGVVNGG